MVIDIQDDLLKIHKLGLLDRLLVDKTTKKNIMWATNAYCSLGARYDRNEAITVDLITGSNSGVIKTRARKEMEQQSERTRHHAEVFTPRWICQKMNDHADEVWFGSGEVFFQDGGPTPVVSFPPKKSWKQYVDSRRLEITCGEAPYLVSRYDAETGEMLPLAKRIGLLDRKLRVVGENTQTEEEWLKWAIRAFQATYGYEFQGDNVLIARVNLLMTFEEYLQARWEREPTKAEWQKLVNIITWNIWQMDGLSGTIPYGTAEEKFQQMAFDEMFYTDEHTWENRQPQCRIYNWLGDRSVEFLSLPTGGNHAMKFDYIIGNPPYQDETNGELRNYAPPIYHLFLDAAYQIADSVELIHPARFLFNAGSTPKSWNEKMLQDEHLKVVYYEQDSGKIFPGLSTPIKGGIAITYRDANNYFGPTVAFTQYPEVNSIAHKVTSREDFVSLTEIVFSRTSYRLTNKMHQENPQAIEKLSQGHAYDMSSNILQRLPEIFYDAQPEDGAEYIRILGRDNNHRVYKFIRRDYVNQVKNLDSYKLYVAQANGSGTFGDTMSPPIVEEPGVGATETFISIGDFSTRAEAIALEKYIKTKFTRTLLSILKVTQNGNKPVWRMIPIQIFSSNSDIDWSKSISEIDQQLYTKYGLDEKEIQFIESHVKEMV